MLSEKCEESRGFQLEVKKTWKEHESLCSKSFRVEEIDPFVHFFSFVHSTGRSF